MLAVVMEKLKLLWYKTNRWHRVLFIFIIAELQLLPNGQLGFHCNDPALSYPYTGDTVSWKWLMAVCLLLPLIVMLLAERKYNASEKERPKKRALRWYKEYIYGFLINLTVVQMLKHIVGSPRPHFFDTCKPMEALTCEGMEFVPRYTCTRAHWLNQSDRSFPSGHTSLALHAGIFIVYYLHRRTKYSSTIKTIQVLSILAAVFCAISRMIDHRHHWWDVLAGSVIAVAVLVYTLLSLCRNFECANTDVKEKDNHITSDSDVPIPCDT